MEFTKSLSAIKMVGEIDSKLTYLPESSDYSLVLRVHAPHEPRLQGHLAILRGKQKILDWVNFLLNTGKNVIDLEVASAPAGFSVKHDLGSFDAFEFSIRSFWDGEEKFIVLAATNPANLRRSPIVLFGDRSEFHDNITKYIVDLAESLSAINLFNSSEADSIISQVNTMISPSKL